MRSYWIWFLLLVVSWLIFFSTFLNNPEEMPWRIASSALFFAVYFITPLLRRNPVGLTINLSFASLIAVIALWPEKNADPNLYLLLILSIIAGEAVYRLTAPLAVGVGTILLIGAMAPSLGGYPAISPVFLVLYGLIYASAMVVFRTTLTRKVEMTAQYEALLSEYRRIKRQNAADEQTARQDERAQVGRDIHDSVGHKLTALLMQLEVFRMEADSKTASRMEELKELAKDSLEETRNAVKALKHHEAGGLSAILSLIRKLESESFFRVNFTVKYGALSAPLSNAQSIAVYRAVQEALTNIMRHSNARDAEIMFEAPGGGVFRFEVINAMKEKDKEDKPFREGFGLRSMRERIEATGGRLEIISYEDRFVVRGTLSMVKKGDEEL